MGVAEVLDNDTPESVFEWADAALYRAKSGGRNCTCCHHGGTIVEVAKDAAPPSAAPAVQDELNSVGRIS